MSFLSLSETDGRFMLICQVGGQNLRVPLSHSLSPSCTFLSPGPAGRREGCLQVQVARSTQARQVQTECEEAADSELGRNSAEVGP